MNCLLNLNNSYIFSHMEDVNMDKPLFLSIKLNPANLKEIINTEKNIWVEGKFDFKFNATIT